MEIYRFFRSKIETFIECSIGDTECSFVIETTKKICMYKSMEKLKSWTSANLEKPETAGENDETQAKPAAAAPVTADNIQIKSLVMSTPDGKYLSTIYKDIKVRKIEKSKI